MTTTDEVDDKIPTIETIDVLGDGGLLKRVLSKGTELIPRGATAIIHYTGKLEDGTVFDSSASRGVPYTFKIGFREVILGWDLGIATMRRGEKSQLLLKSEYAYGKEAVGPIPPYSNLVYDLELVGWEFEKKEGLALLPILTITVFVLLLGCFVGSVLPK